MPDDAIRVHGLRELRRYLRAMDKALPRELGRDLKGAVERTVLPAARSAAPHRTGRLADSLKAFSRATTVGVRSRLPYAQPIHWGWPRRNIAPNPFIDRAFEQNADALLDATGDVIEELADRHGFH